MAANYRHSPNVLHQEAHSLELLNSTNSILLSAYAKLRTGNYTEIVVLDSQNTKVYVQAA